jgi:putative ABC transport system permease protein
VLQNIGLDFRYGIRSLRATPAATIGAILTLTLGIGMSTAVFGVVNGVLLEPLAFAHENRLITICEHYPGSTPGWCSISPPTLEDIAAGAKSIDAIGLGRQWPYHLATRDGAVAIQGGLATPEMFTALSVRPERGRLFDRSELIGRQSTVGVITHESWQSRFGGDPGIVGRVVDLDGDAVTIIGVLPPGFAPPRIEGVEIWRPLHVNPRDEVNREWRGFIAFGRLRDGVSETVARQELAAITARVRNSHFSAVPNWDLQLVGLRDLVVRDTRTRLLVFMGAVLVVLMIGCVNVANLLLARAATRGREMALRTALGATSTRIVRALLIEASLLAGIGAAGGIALAIGASRAFVALAPSGVPRVEEVRIDAKVLAFSIGLAVLCTIVFGLVPALRAAHVDLASALPGSGRGTSHRTGRLSRALVVIELGLAVTLVAAAGLLTRSFAGMTAWHPGFDQEHVVTFSLFAPTSKYSTKELVGGLWRRVENELLSIPGVVDAGTASQGPLFGARETWEMQAVRRGTTISASVRWADVSPSFFPALGVPIVRGRAISEADMPDSPLVGMVNESLARSFWPNEDPIGKTLVFPQGEKRMSFTVVGVVRDVPQVRPDMPVEPQLYWSNRQLPRPFTFVLVRTTVPPATIVSAVRSRIKAIDRDLEPRSILTMNELVSTELRTPRFTMLLVIVFGGAALLLAAVGTYSLLSFGVSQRTREIGIRLALGAERRRIIADVASSGLLLAGGGLALGLAGALVTGRALRGMIAGVSVADPLTLGATTIVLIAVAALASTFPAWRASRVDPNIALRTDT